MAAFGTMAAVLEASDPDAVLARCVFSVSAPGAVGGTGFLVAPGILVTCAHVVAGAEGGRVEVCVAGERGVGTVTALYPPVADSRHPLYPFPDLAVIRIADDVAGLCAPLDDAIPRLGDQLHCLGFSATLGSSGGAEPATFVFEGLHEVDGGRLFKLGAGATAVPGMSGAPLVNLRTGRVCGLLKTSRDPDRPHGGWGVPIAALHDSAPAVAGTHAEASVGPVWSAAFPVTDDALSHEVAELLPESLRNRLGRSADCLYAAAALGRDALKTSGAASVTGRFRRTLALAVALAEPDALRALAPRDALLLCAVARCLADDHARLPSLRTAIRHDPELRRTWIAYVHAIDAMPLETWRERFDDASLDGPQAQDLAALPNDLGPSELLGVQFFAEQYRIQLTAALARTAPDDTVVSAAVGAFPEFPRVLGALLTTLDEPPDAFARRCADLLGGARSVAGCRVLYVGVLLRAALSLQRLIDVDADGTLTPVRAPAAVDRHLSRLQQQVHDIRLQSEEQGEALHLICGPATPRLLEELRVEIGSLRDALVACTVVLARSYRVGQEAVFRLRYELVRSNVDDAGRYVEEAGLPFEPELGRLALRASGVLPLFVRPLYGHRPEVGVRELLQNGLDAVWARRAIERAEGRAELEGAERVLVALSDRSGPVTTLLRSTVPPPSEWHHWIEVRDPGVGMTPDVVREHFLTVGGSYDPAEDLTRRAAPGRTRRLRIGRFGIGVCAAFLLGTEVQVITRHLTAQADRAVCMRFVERDDTTEMYRCAASVGTTVRVRLSEEAYQRLSGDPDLWDWFARSDPQVVRVSVRDGVVHPIESILRELLGNGEVRELSVPPYGTARWTPSPESFKSHIFVNGIRIVSLHRNFDRNILAPVGQLKQPVIDIDDATGATDLLLTRDGFAGVPETVFAAVRRDGVTDHVAWTVRVAAAGPDRPLPWESRLWEEERYSAGQGDGVIHAMPFVVTAAGLVPLDSGLAARAGITEVTFLLVRGGMIAHDEPKDFSRTPPPLTAVALLDVVRPAAGAAVGVMQVDMFGGFGYSTFAAGIAETFGYGAKLGATTQLQLVTPSRSDAYAKMNDTDVVARWSDGVLLRATEARTFSYTSEHELDEQRRAADVVRRRNYVRIDRHLAALDEPGGPTAGDLLQRVVAAGGYGVLHAWFAGPDDEPVPPPERSELEEVWRLYRLPPALPFAARIHADATPLAADLRLRMERVSREDAATAAQGTDGKVPGRNISTPQWRARRW
jgi:hypothetical protein